MGIWIAWDQQAECKHKKGAALNPEAYTLTPITRLEGRARERARASERERERERVFNKKPQPQRLVNSEAVNLRTQIRLLPCPRLATKDGFRLGSMNRWGCKGSIPPCSRSLAPHVRL